MGRKAQVHGQSAHLSMGDQTLQPIKKRIKQLHGQFYYLYKGNDLIGCLFKVGKVKHKQFPFPIGL